MAYTRSDPLRILVHNSLNGVTQEAVPYTFGRTRTGSKVDNWKNKVQKGLNAGSPYSIDSTEVTDWRPGLAILKYHQGNAPSINFRDKFEGFAFTSVSDVNHLVGSYTDVENEAITKIIRKVRSTRSEMNGQSFVGELRDTIHMLRHPYQSAVDKLYNHLDTLSKRKGAAGRAARRGRDSSWTKVLADTWLGTSFGLKPLISDAKAIAESLARYNARVPARKTLRAQSNETETATFKDVSAQFFPGSDYFMYRRFRETESKAFCSFSVGMEATVRAGGYNQESLADVFGFTPENFVPALYEVAPWSWLIDYFSNLGNIIEAGCTSSAGVSWISKSVGYKTSVILGAIPAPIETMARFSGNSNVFDSLQCNTLGSFRMTRATFNRSIPASLPVPSLTLTYPGRGTQWTNLVAVLAQFKGRQFEPKMAQQLSRFASPSARSKAGVHAPEAFL